MKRRKFLCIIGLTIAMLCSACGADNSKVTDEQRTEKESTDNDNTEEGNEDIDSEDEDEQSEKSGKPVESLLGVADDSGRIIDVHDIDGNVAITYKVPDHFYLCDNMGNLGVEEFKLTYPYYEEAIGMQSEVIKIDSLKEIGICSVSHSGFEEKKENYQEFYIATVETKQGNVYDIVHFQAGGGFEAFNPDDYAKEHIHFIIRGWVQDDVADKEPWTEDEVIDIVTNCF